MSLFTDDNENAVDVTMALTVLPLFSLTNFVEMSIAYFLGIVRALGIQAKIALISIGCFYLISLPSVTYLAMVRDAGTWGKYPLPFHRRSIPTQDKD